MTEPSNQSATTKDFYDKLKSALGMRESSNNYKAVNQFGYIGKYQFGATALIDLGYLARNTSQQTLYTLTKLIADEETPPIGSSEEVLAKHSSVMSLNSKYWLGKDGVYSTKKGFLDRPEIQEKCIDRWLVILQKTLIRIKVIDNETTAQESGGFMCASHLIGCGGARDMKNGITKKDGNGVTGEIYYKLGYAAISGGSVSSVVIAPSETKIENPNREPSTIAGVGRTVTAQPIALPGIGFSDPSGKYPTYTNEADTSRLMRHQNIRETIIPDKDNTRTTGVRIAGSTGTWDQPPVPYNTKYPYNQVLETESGHIMEFDDTPENERIHIYHKTGTFIEVDRNGTKVTRIVGDDYTILDRNGFVSISGNCNITVEGNANLCVKNDLNLEVNGNLNASITGNANWNVEGAWNVSAYAGASYRVNGGFGVVTKGNANITCGGSFGVSADGKIMTSAGATYDVSSKGAFTINSEADATIKTFSALNLGSNGLMSLKSNSNTSINASRLDLNSSDATNNAKIGEVVKLNLLKNWQPPHLPESLKITELAPLTLPIRSFETVAEFDDNPDASPEEIAAHRKELVQKGLSAVNPLSPKVQDVPVDMPPKDAAPITQPIIDFKSNQININDYISKNFTLAMLMGGKKKLVGQSGLTDVQLATNLKYLAVNVLDPIKAKYPDMSINSGLRPMGKNSRSQHPLGMAADLHFGSHTSAEYVEIAKWILSNVVYDQCLLEFRTSSANSRPGSPVTWIHVSYNHSNNRKMYFSMNDDVRISPIGVLKQVTC